jgi:hypothetical protein
VIVPRSLSLESCTVCVLMRVFNLSGYTVGAQLGEEDGRRTHKYSVTKRSKSDTSVTLREQQVDRDEGGEEEEEEEEEEEGDG